jgi:hypothetical protein
MFGHDWEPAQGTVIDQRIKGFTEAGPGFDPVSLHEFVVDVRLPDGTQFRTLVEEPRSGKIVPPPTGAVVRVQVDRKNQKVRFDTSDPTVNTNAVWKKVHEAPDSFRDALTQPPGTPPPGSGR